MPGRGLDRGLDAGCGAELGAGIVDVKIDRAFRLLRKRGASAVNRSRSSKPDITGMLMSESTRSGIVVRIAAKPSRPS
jgi:hypothetical protein